MAAAGTLQMLTVGFEVPRAWKGPPSRITVQSGSMLSGWVCIMASCQALKSAGALLADFRMLFGQVVLLMRIRGNIKENFIWEQVVAVVVGAHIEPGAEADTALADMGALANHQIGPAGVLSG